MSVVATAVAAVAAATLGPRGAHRRHGGCGRRCRSRFSRSATHGTWVGRRNPGPPCRLLLPPIARGRPCCVAQRRLLLNLRGLVRRRLLLLRNCGRGEHRRGHHDVLSESAAFVARSAASSVGPWASCCSRDGLRRATVILHRIDATTHTVAADLGLRCSRARLTRAAALTRGRGRGLTSARTSSWATTRRPAPTRTPPPLRPL